MESLNDLFRDTLKDIYYAEKAILKALPKMAKKASSEQLAAAFTKHHGETQNQIARLEQVFGLISVKPSAKKCAAIEGILEEATEIMSEAEDDTVRDAGMLAAAQAVEHYEIARYGTLAAWARKLDMEDAEDLLMETLDEEKATDEALTELAVSEINLEADHSDEADGDQDDDDGKATKSMPGKKTAKRAGSASSERK